MNVRRQLAGRREQVVALAVLGGFVLVSLLVWLVVVVATGSDGDGPSSDEGSLAGAGAADAGAGAADEGDGAADEGDGADVPDEDGDAAAEDAGDPAAGETGEGDDPDDDVTRIDFHGMCTVELDPETSRERARPWHYDECERAPIGLEEGQLRWIVVLDSLDGDAVSESEALQRVDTGAGQQLLWSSHYPSLNPGLWVVADGPYADVAAARAAAEELGGGAYPRELSDDTGDRYCSVSDGCSGASG